MAYSVKVLDHYENPRNVGSFTKEEEGGVGTGMAVGFALWIYTLLLPALSHGKGSTILFRAFYISGAAVITSGSLGQAAIVAKRTT